MKRLKDGNILVKARVLRISSAIQATKVAVREAADQHRRRRRMVGNGGIVGGPPREREALVQGNRPPVERVSNEGSRNLGMIDTQAINKKVGKAAQGLWKMMGNAAQVAKNHLDMEVWLANLEMRWRGPFIQFWGCDIVMP